jgi:hypothetical protein
MSHLIDNSGLPIFPRDGTREVWELRQQAKAVPASASLISRREWFITNAPEVPKWFRNKAEGAPPPNPPELLPEEELTPGQQQELAAWTAGAATDFAGLSRPVQDFMVRWQRVQNQRKEFNAWHMERREEKWWAWANYFADKMTEGGSK